MADPSLTFMSEKITPHKELDACQYRLTCQEVEFTHGIVSPEGLNSYQRLQMKHDETYHYEILALGVSRRMNHVALHLIKYLHPLSSLPTS